METRPRKLAGPQPLHSFRGNPAASKRCPNPAKGGVQKERAERGPGSIGKIGGWQLEAGTQSLHSVLGAPLIVGTLSCNARLPVCKKPAHRAISPPASLHRAFSQISSSVGPELCPGPGAQAHPRPGEHELPAPTMFTLGIQPSTLNPHRTSVRKRDAGMRRWPRDS